MSDAFSERVTNVLRTLDPGRRPTGTACFPPQTAGADTGVGKRESPAVWFRRLVDGPLGRDIQACAVEENLALFLQFSWTAGRRFGKLNCQTLAVLDGTLEDAYEQYSPARSRYLRLEYDASPLVLGELFSHPVAHVHGQPDDAPRYALEGGGPTTVLLDFLDFLYRNFCHREWARWAALVWRRRALSAEEVPHFEAIRAFFVEKDTPAKRQRLPDMLDLCRRWLPPIKRALREEKEAMPMNLSIDSDHRDLFTYHH